MKKIVAAVATLTVSFLLVPVIGAPALAQGTESTVSGTVTNDSGAPVASVRIALHGPRSYTTTTDASGQYGIVSVGPGTYTLHVSKSGYQTVEESIDVGASVAVIVNVRLPVASFSSLQTIANVRAGRNGTFNTSTAAVNVVTSQTIMEQGATSIGQGLNEVPGVQISLPGSDANGAAPGAIAVPNVRNGLSYETASMVDGHPLATSAYGDYVVTFLEPFLLQSAEVIKGPGAASPVVNYAINGSVNFRTKDPTPNLDTFYTVGANNRNGATWAFGVSDTVDRVGFVVGIAGLSDPSAINNIPVYYDPASGQGFIGPNAPGSKNNLYPYACNGIGGSSSPTPLLGTNGNTYYSRVYNGCSALAQGSISANFDGLGELVKMRYRIGTNTYLTGSYFGSQTTADQSGNLSQYIPSIFEPGPSYHGALQPGPIAVLSAGYNAQPQTEYNNEPIFQLELSTSIGTDSLLARYYHASVDRIIESGLSNPADYLLQYQPIWGTLPKNYPTALTFSGGPYWIDQANYFNQVENDQLQGYTLEYTHPLSNTNEVTLSGDLNDLSSADYYHDVSFGGAQCGQGMLAGGYCYDTTTTIPAGSGHQYATVLLRDREQFTPKFAGTLALYQDWYHNSFATNCGAILAKDEPECLPNGTLLYTTGTPYVTPANFSSTVTAHTDPRIGLEWRPEDDLAVRASAGSSIAPPYLYVLSQANHGIYIPSNPGPANPATETINNGSLRAETAFGYDLGADYRLHDQTVVSSDVFLTNLYGQFLQESYSGGLCSVKLCGQKGIPLFYTQYVNLSNARYEGVELSIKHAPVVGFGWTVQGSTQTGYPYNLPPNFYCQLGKGIPCTPKNYNVNLNILPNQNFYGEYINSSGSTTQGVDNQSVPYLQGNAEVSYHLRNGAFALFGGTLFGKNNSYNRPPFTVAYATLNYPVTRDVAVQISGYNLFNTYSSIFPTYGAGVTVPLANGQSAGTIGNVVGPARYLFLLTKTIGPEVQSTGGKNGASR